MQPAFGHWTLLRNGNTICIRYAERHRFLDGSEGIRVGYYDNIKIVKLPLNELLALSDDLPEVRIKAAEKTCWNCKKTAKSTCGFCKLAYYCSKECQNENWQEEHRRICLALADYMDLVDIDFKEPINTYNGVNLKFFKKPFNKQAPQV